MKPIVTLVLALAVALAGCAGYSGRGLVPGQSSTEEVEALMGPAAEVRAGAAGETVRYYSRLPAGRETYAARIGPDGKLRAIEQRLTEANAARLRPGHSSSEEVRDLLGPPWSIDRLPRLMREVWTYPMRGTEYPKALYVQFSADGVVREVLFMNDPSATRSPGVWWQLM